MFYDTAMYNTFNQPLNNFSNLLVRKTKFLSFKKLWSRQIVNLQRKHSEYLAEYFLCFVENR
jgi:hypothetical protein